MTHDLRSNEQFQFSTKKFSAHARSQVSILTPVFNEAQYITEMMESVIAQSFRDWELLIVDDGSTDDTWEIVQSFARRDSRIRPIGKPGKRGKVAAFNEAYVHSRGDAIMLLGGDDRLPESSLETRFRLLGDDQTQKSVAYFRLRTFSTDKKFNGIVVPKGPSGNRSGGTLAMNRKLADIVFPIPEELVSEDIWIAQVNELLADRIAESPDIVLEYRIHAGNSNPRHLKFTDMNESLHLRALPFERILSTPRLVLSAQQRSLLSDKILLEDLRYRGSVTGILFSARRPLKDKLRALGASNPFMYGVRTRFYKFFSGWS